MRTDGQTDMTKLIVAFRHFSNSPKNVERYGARFETPVFEFAVFYDYLKRRVTLAAVRLTYTASPFYSLI
jgi:hypothetical protein